MLRRMFDSGMETAVFADTSMAELVRRDLASLEQAIGGAPYELRDEHPSTCRIVTDRFMVTIGWLWREQWIDAEIRLLDLPDLPFESDLKHSARDWLEALALPTLPRRAGAKSSLLLRDELELVRRVVGQIFDDPRAMRAAIFYLSGRIEGYNDRVAVPEDQPPQAMLDWAEERRRLRKRG